MPKTSLEPAEKGAFLPPQVYFLVSAVFHYLGPAFAVLLFARVDVLGVAWLRIASAAAVFAVWRQPWRYFLQASTAQRWLLLGLGLVLALMNCCFYLAIDRLPLATVGAIEYLASIVLAAIGVRTWRNLIALGLAIGGVGLLTNLRLEAEPIGLALACANGGLFMLYIILGHRIARDGGQAGIDRLGASMLIALIVVMPFGFKDALPTLTQPLLLIAGIGVGICSSVIPYICDQLAMARLPRATFALLLSLLPASAALIGFLVLGQIPSVTELFGIALVIVGVAIHQQKF
jgi:inner membrane transporter RhtA